MRIPDHIVFGGTFDPPHQGHVDCVALAKDAFPQAKISIVPSPAPAGAAGQHKRPLTSFGERAAMVTIAMKSLLSDKIRINELEAQLPQPNYSLQTLEVLRQAAPQEALALLMGEDQLASFAMWRQPRQILEIADVVVARRQGAGYLDADPWPNLGRDLDISLQGQTNGAYAPELDTFFVVLEGRISDASSTAIRQALKENKPIPQTWLPAELVTWIAQKKLYLPAS